MTRILVGSIVGALAAFLARPCCAVPMAMSLAGVSGIGVAQVAVTHRTALMTASIVMLGGALWMTFRRQGGSFSKILAASATLAGFGLSLRLMGVF